MDRFSGNGAQGGTGNGYGSEDASRAREHAQNAEENRDALEAQSRSTDATAPASADQPVRGMDAAGSEDASRAAANADEAERNRDALEAQSRRVESTTPDDVRNG